MQGVADPGPNKFAGSGSKVITLFLIKKKISSVRCNEGHKKTSAGRDSPTIFPTSNMPGE